MFIHFLSWPSQQHTNTHIDTPFGIVGSDDNNQHICYDSVNQSILCFVGEEEGSKYVLRDGVRDVIKSGCGKENVDPNFIKSELAAMDKIIDGGKNVEIQNTFQIYGNNKTINDLVEEKGFVLIQATSDMVKGFNSSQSKAASSQPSSPPSLNVGIHAKGILGKIPGTSPVHETSHVTILIPMKIVKHSGSGNDEVMNEGSNDDVKMGSDTGTDLKMKQGVSFLDLKWDNEPMIVDNDSKSKSSQWLLLSMMLAKSLMLELLKLLAPWLI
ncbi:unnamed protein product [Lactuca virosa]|uniref:Uncharacterized protein n=1 Tax=Lactuca virosa TaxID=75947 RepID=A0AAU9PSC0_9ASTR|nr:unnamed protein product [Lactuca virosa]